MNAIKSFQDTVRTYHLFTSKDKLLLAVSGGSDSIALYNICRDLGYSIGIAHVNFQLRGDDSDNDALFVEGLARSMAVEYHSKRTDCKKHAEEQSISIQEAARNLRYEFFEHIRIEHNYDYILTAHHAADNMETILYSLIKGATLNALRGIPLRRGKILRPLLYTLKSDIDDLVSNKKLPYRKDQSNASSKYQRNFIRHEIVPKINQVNPSVESTLIETSILGAQLQEWIGAIVENDQRLLNQSSELNLKLKESLPYRLAWLYEVIKPLGFNLSDCKDIWNAFTKIQSTGKLFYGKKATLMIYRENLIRTEKESASSDICRTIHSIASCSKDSGGILKMAVSQSIMKDPKVANIDANRISFPLILRPWNEEDKFFPLGMNGNRKLVKTFLKDTHIRKDKRDQILVLESNGDIVWIVGWRIDDRFKVAESTTEIIRISQT